jgi:hypothetical protein
MDRGDAVMYRSIYHRFGSWQMVGYRWLGYPMLASMVNQML